MPKGVFNVPIAVNEPVRDYDKGSLEREEVLDQYQSYYQGGITISQCIGGEKIITEDLVAISPPHDHRHIIGHYYRGSQKHVRMAIDNALASREKWVNLSWEYRASIFLKAAELIAGPYRAKINASTMIGQSKNIHQAEIDAACEFVDFLRYNVEYMSNIYREQPESSEGIWNRLEYRPLEGFVYAITPFNFTSIAGNLCACVALMGNVVVWKPSDNQIFSAQVILDVFKEAGLPDGVINMVLTDGEETAKTVFKNPHFSGVHFTGSTSVFKEIWKTIGENINIYKSYPRIVGETGGKDFIWAHPSSDTQSVVTAISRGAFEFQGQKCSAASRAYIPKSLWAKIKESLIEDVNSMKIGSPYDTSNFINAVIDKKSFDRLSAVIDRVKNDKNVNIIAGGTYDDSKGYFITPTVIESNDPEYFTMTEELFGPIITIYLYNDEDWKKTLDLVDETSPYALTGAIFSRDIYSIEYATKKLTNSAGNFYINDKPTGAVVGQQPFGGARASGTNDKAGSAQNLLRWVSPRLIKETFIPAKNYRYPFLTE
ncbi:L-glutamate gamma-semialdehyde dehydrogenase [Ichthyobacterium seriolicida]|uniref:L-glutamate gamma-semialdehyde dehydrogenase n=1 Tax=Ichthyobacterium seriolicida TaxID=242600 RepID=A0A1J1E0Y7_9FLAO|nr:L-glutamate gamma-semialdehyde dehydrogenase [Ichthyobacterium seriolicida]BAV94605.1 delta-1-pyrroline-5-carboxylate dehydrogenase [Ichthyobacterium seriolicida]